LKRWLGNDPTKTTHSHTHTIRERDGGRERVREGEIEIKAEGEIWEINFVGGKVYNLIYGQELTKDCFETFCNLCFEKTQHKQD